MLVKVGAAYDGNTIAPTYMCQGGVLQAITLASRHCIAFPYLVLSFCPLRARQLWSTALGPGHKRQKRKPNHPMQAHGFGVAQLPNTDFDVAVGLSHATSRNRGDSYAVPSGQKSVDIAAANA